MKACFLIVNQPGLRSKESFPNGNLHLGSFSRAPPIGKTRICATTYDMVKDGYRKASEVFLPRNPRRLAYQRPKNSFAPEKSMPKMVIRIPGYAPTAVAVAIDELDIHIRPSINHCYRRLLGHFYSIHRPRLPGLSHVSEAGSYIRSGHFPYGQLVSFNIPLEGFNRSEFCLFRSIR